MTNKILKYLVTAMNYSDKAVFGFKKNSNRPFLSNKAAVKHFGNESGSIDIAKIFSLIPQNDYWRTSIDSQLQEEGCVKLYDLSVLATTGACKIADLHLGYANEEKNILFAEFFFKEDTRLEQAVSQVNQSIRAEGIFRLEDKLPLIHCNSLFYHVFDSDEEKIKDHYNNELYYGFPEDIRDELLKKIHSSLETYPSFYSKIKVVTVKGTETWYSLELQRRTLDDSGTDMVMASMVNIENQIEIEEKLDVVSQYFDAIQNLSDDMLYRVDLQSRTLYRTTKQAKSFGINEIMPDYPQSIVESGMIHPDDLKIYSEYGQKLLSGGEAQVEIRMKSTDGAYGFRRLTCTPVFDGEGNVKEMFGKIVNIQMVRELEKQANFDALTKLLNKRAMLESTSQILQNVDSNEKHALFFMDLDDFKYVNDNLGHAFGDFLLAELGKRLRDSVRSKDLVGRVGGDEFVIFLHDIPSIDTVMGKAKMLLSTISEDFSDGITWHSMHGSIGIALFPDNGTTYEELYHHADLALYCSKRKGKNQVTLYTPDME